MSAAQAARVGTAERVRSFFRVFDARFEDLRADTWKKVAYRDLSAGLIVALTAIPLAMGFAIAMGLRPEQGIIAGALACIIGRTFGGSKYQVYGPTAAFIPVIASLMNKYGEANGGSFAQAHGYLVFVSMIAGVVLVLAGVAGLGRFAKAVPSSIVVGFTIGIAVTIALSNFGESLGIAAPPGSLRTKVVNIVSNIGSGNLWAFSLALLTFVLAKGLLRISIFIPAPIIALGVCTLLAGTVMGGHDIKLIRDQYGSIPNNFFVFTPPALPSGSWSLVFDTISSSPPSSSCPASRASSARRWPIASRTTRAPSSIPTRSSSVRASSSS